MGISHRSYSDDAYSIIRAKIIDDEVPFGGRLHITNLAAELGISPTPVREALNRLAADGLAEMTPHKGIFVVDPCERQVRELCEARLCMEQQMAEAVILNATPERLAKLHQYAATEVDTRETLGFHDYYADIAENRVLQRLHAQVHSLLKVLFAKAIKKSEPTYLVKHQQEEMDILDAIKARDGVKLREAIRIHINGFQKILLDTGVAKRDG